jgi:molybdate transport system substrate-binding protein
MFRNLGIEAQVAPTSRMIPVTPVGEILAKGEADVGFQQVSELLPIAGIVFLGPIPEAVQKVTTFSAGVPVAAPQPDLARELLAFLTTASSRAVVEKTGLESLR